MYKLFIVPLIVFFSLNVAAQTPSEVLTVHEWDKVVVWNEPQDMSKFVFMGEVPVTWENKSIAKPKMTGVLIGGNLLYYRTKTGKYDAYSMYKIDLGLVQKTLSEKDKFKVLEKVSIERGPGNYKNEKQDTWAKFENPRMKDEWVLIDGKISGEPVKTFVITRASATQWVLKTYEQEHIINYIIQVN